MKLYSPLSKSPSPAAPARNGDVPDLRPIDGEWELRRPFHDGFKQRSEWLVGVEQEKIAVDVAGGCVVYDGPRGITALVASLRRRGFEDLRDGTTCIGAARGREEITLEPGLQVELSAPPFRTARECCELMGRHLAEVQDAAAPLGIRFLAGGFHPFATLDEIPWLPKRRYAAMRTYLPTRGARAHDMMKRTATVQVNLDCADEDDAADKLRVAMGLQSIVTALYASSPVAEGRPSGYQSLRAAAWLETDEDRCGLLPFVFERGFTLEHYIQWALDVPMLFLSRGGRYHAPRNLTFRRFMSEGWSAQRATGADWSLHLSTLFPEVRLRGTLELRGADATFQPLAQALPALWRGVLYDDLARATAWELVSAASVPERQALRQTVPRAGMAAFLGRRAIAPLAKELVAIAGAGLRRLPDGDLDVPLLDPLRERATTGRSPADDMLLDFERVGGDRARLTQVWALGERRET